jgi:hypothetical protein
MRGLDKIVICRAMRFGLSGLVAPRGYTSVRAVFDESFAIRQAPTPYVYPFDEQQWLMPSPNDQQGQTGKNRPALVKIMQKVCLSLGANDMRVANAVPQATCRCLQQLYPDEDLRCKERMLTRCGNTDPGDVRELSVLYPLALHNTVTDLRYHKRTTQITSGLPRRKGALTICGSHRAGSVKLASRKWTPPSHTNSATPVAPPCRLQHRVTLTPVLGYKSTSDT